MLLLVRIVLSVFDFAVLFDRILVRVTLLNILDHFHCLVCFHLIPFRCLDVRSLQKHGHTDPFSIVHERLCEARLDIAHSSTGASDSMLFTARSILAIGLAKI